MNSTEYLIGLTFNLLERIEGGNSVQIVELLIVVIILFTLLIKKFFKK